MCNWLVIIYLHISIMEYIYLLICFKGPACVLEGERILEDNTVIYGNCIQRESISKQPVIYIHIYI